LSTLKPDYHRLQRRPGNGRGVNGDRQRQNLRRNRAGGRHLDGGHSGGRRQRAGAGTVTVTVEGQSAAGNPVSISHDVKVDLAAVAISINPIASDDVINAAEKGADLVLSGSTTNVEENQTVTITFGGKSYTATVDATATGRRPYRLPIWAA
jgi:hypothetical protein